MHSHERLLVPPELLKVWLLSRSSFGLCCTNFPSYLQRRRIMFLKSMNRDEGSYQLPHVYDKLFATVATSSGKRKSTTSFGRRQ